MKELWWLSRRTLSAALRKKSGWIMLFILPVAGVLVSLLIYGGGSSSILRVGIVNQDGDSPITQNTMNFILNMNNAEVTVANTEETLKDQIASGSLDTGIVLESGFAEHVQSGHPEGLTVLSVKGAQVTAYLKSLLQNYIVNVASIGAATQQNPALFDQIYKEYNENHFKLDAAVVQDTSKAKNMTYQSMGFLIAFMMFSACNLTHLILKEKENRTYLRLLTSPVSAKMYVLSNVLVNIVLLMTQIALTLVVLKVVLGIDSGIPTAELVATLFLYGLTAIGLSLVIVAFAKNSSMSGALQNLIITPTCLLAGCYFPVDIMPDSVRKIATFLPQHWLLETVNDLQTGTPFGHLYLNLLIMAAFAAAFSLIAVYRFSRNNDTRTFV
ncbi:ABC transporter permease [Paenibacillus physcomitrellae]|uniref:Transport permease protein n=1 Tax=Paenibacillus physcomitrellae TaxID=1619311 RepID=A0ABQ1FPG4_9BACL|nr:ABC transporter permease [Paenibacillus physcomitrellae]GGA23979.1 ABC transporter permease [Paenibacillus physcomitrellae]